MLRVTTMVAFALLSWQTPTLIRTAVQQPAAQPPERNPTALRALKVLDSLIPAPAPRSFTRAQTRTWANQTTWLKSLRERIRNLLSLVVAPAKVPTPAPIDQKNLLALQEEAEKESLRFDLSSRRLKARHDAAMAAIRNMKSE
jgi:hypothetical protein